MFFICFFVILVQGTVNWQSCQDFQTGRVSLFSELANSATPIANYQIIHAALSGGPFKAAISPTGFDIKQSNDIWIDTIIEFVDSTGMQVVITILKQTIAYNLKIDYINFKARAEIDIIHGFIQCKVINQGVGYRREVHIMQNPMSSKVVKLGTFIQHLSFSNHKGEHFYIKLISNFNQNIIATTVEVAGLSQAQYVRYWIFIYDQFNSNQNLQMTVVIGSLRTLNLITYNYQNLVRFHASNRQIFGIRQLYFIRSDETSIVYEFDTTSYADFYVNYRFQQLQFVSLTAVMVVCRSCDAGYYFYRNQSDVKLDDCVSQCPLSKRFQVTQDQICKGCLYSCQQCSDSDFDVCTKCSAGMHREQDANWSMNGSCECIAQFIDLGESTCYPCRDLIPGCDICLSKTQCTNCASSLGYVLNITTKLCECQASDEFIMSGMCISMPGCISALHQNSRKLCTSCNKQKHFKLANYNCICQQSYSLFNNTGDYICLPICGNGQTVGTEQCDDGNTLNNDGCSSECKVQPDYICSMNVSARSLCRQDVIFKLLAVIMIRVVNSNQVIILITMSPTHNRITHLNFSQILKTNIPHHHLQASYLVSHIHIKIKYDESIEMKEYSLWIDFNQTQLFSNQSQILNFTAQGDNCQLTYDNDTQLQVTLCYLMIALACAAYVGVLLSVFTQKWIGIEQIQTFQLTFYIMICLSSIPLQLTPLTQSLKVVSGISTIQQDYYYRISNLPKQLIGLGLQKEFLLNINITYALMVFALLVVAILFMVYHQQLLADQMDPTITKRIEIIQYVIRLVVNRVYLVIVFIEMLQVMICFQNQVSHHSANVHIIDDQVNIFAAIIAYLIVLITICYVCFSYLTKQTAQQGGTIFKKQNKFRCLQCNKMLEYYPMIYLIYKGTFMTLLATFYSSAYYNYMAAGMQILYIIIIIILRPYRSQCSQLHNFSIVFNEIVVLSMCMISLYWNIGADQLASQQTIMQYFAIAIMAMLFVCTLLTYARIIQLLCQSQQNIPADENQLDSMKILTVIQLNKQKDDMLKLKNITSLNIRDTQTPNQALILSKEIINMSNEAGNTHKEAGNTHKEAGNTPKEAGNTPKEIINMPKEEVSMYREEAPSKQLLRQLKESNFSIFSNQQNEQQKVSISDKPPKKIKEGLINYMIPKANNNRSALKQKTFIEKMQQKQLN